MGIQDNETMLCLGSQSDTGYVSSSGEVKENSPPDIPDHQTDDEESGMFYVLHPGTNSQTGFSFDLALKNIELCEN